MSEQPPACPALPKNMFLEELEPTYQAIAATQARLIAKGSCLDGLYSVGILLQYIAVIKAQLKQAEAEAAHSNDCAQRAYNRELDAITARSSAQSQASGLKDELAEQETEKLKLIRELEASEKYRHLLTKAILHSTNAPPEPAP